MKIVPAENKLLIRALRGETIWPPPIWLMRQAGRYLPEYRETRTVAGSFLDLCYAPELATEVTLQPIRRYGFDAAILFADILLIPDALGQDVRFVTGEGPRLTPVRDENGFEKLTMKALQTHLAPIFETIRRLCQELPAETALIGFAGAPWTVLTYMVAGRGGQQEEVVAFCRDQPDLADRMIELLVDATARYLTAQVEAGAEALQLFDSWAGSVPDDLFSRLVVRPNASVVTWVRDAVGPEIPIIGFPRGAESRLNEFISGTGVDAVSVGQSVDMAEICDALGDGITLQGNLDPVLLIRGGQKMIHAADGLLDRMHGHPFVFNLGHGITPDVPPENVTALVDRVRQG